MHQDKPTIHIIEVSEPILCYRNLIVRCGQELRTAVPQYMRSYDLRCEINRPFDVCTECSRAPAEQLRYEYGLREAQEEKMIEHDEEEMEVA